MSWICGYMFIAGQLAASMTLSYTLGEYIIGRDFKFYLHAKDFISHKFSLFTSHCQSIQNKPYQQPRCKRWPVYSLFDCCRPLRKSGSKVQRISQQVYGRLGCCWNDHCCYCYAGHGTYPSVCRMGIHWIPKHHRLQQLWPCIPFGSFAGWLDLDRLRKWVRKTYTFMLLKIRVERHAQY